MTHIAFSLPTETEEMANRPIVWGKTPAKEYSQIIQARASVLLANVRLQPIKERHHGFLSTLREAGSRNVPCHTRDNREEFRTSLLAHHIGLNLVSFSNFTLERL